MVFKEIQKIRTKRRIILNTKAPKPVVLGAPAAQPPLRLSFTASGARPNIAVDPAMPPPPKRPAPERTPNSDGSPAKKIKSGPAEGTPKPKKIVKLKVRSQRLAAILRKPPAPKPCSSARSSPAPKPSPAPSPAPSSTISVSPASSTSTLAGKAPAKIRHPLPDSTTASRKPLPASASGGRKPLPDTASASGGRKPLPDSLPKASSTPPPLARAPSAPLKLKLNFKKQSFPPS